MLFYHAVLSCCAVMMGSFYAYTDATGLGAEKFQELTACMWACLQPIESAVCLHGLDELSSAVHSAL